MFDAPKLKTTRGPPDARCAWAISFITSVRLTAAETVIERSDAACGDQANAAARAMVRSTATVYCRRSLGSPVFGLQSRAAVARKQVECEGLAPDCRRTEDRRPKTEDRRRRVPTSRPRGSLRSRRVHARRAPAR